MAHDLPAAAAPILVVDDNLVNATLICHLVSHHGHAAESVASGRAALQRIATGGVCGAIMDLRMPDMDGFDTARAIRASETPATGRMPIIAVSADLQSGLRDRAIAAGMDELLLKPLSIAAVGSALERFFAHQHGPPSTHDASGRHAIGGRPLDPGVLHRAEAMDSGSALRLLRNLFAGLDSTQESLPALVRSGSYLAAQRLVHANRMQALAVGALRLAEVMSELEHALRDGNAMRCSRQLRLLAAERVEFCTALSGEEIAWLPERLSLLQAAAAGPVLR